MAHRWSFWMPPMEHRSLRLLDDVSRGWLTQSGRVLAWATLALAMLHRPTTFLVIIGFGFTTGSLVTAFLTGAFFWPRKKLRLTRHLSPAPSAGEIVSYRVTVQNISRRRVRRIVVEERDLPADLRPVGEPPVIDVLQPGESASVTLQLFCKARGAYRLRRLQAASVYPSALFKWPTWNRTVETLLVYPAITRLEHLEIPLGRSYQPGGISAASRVGDSTEFFGTRDWRRGDRMRDLHWPSFARTGRLIAKEFQEEYFVRVALVVDAEVHTAGQEARFERGLSFAAGAAQVLAREEAIIDLLAAGSEVHRFQAGRALAQYENLLEVLACVEPAYKVDLATAEAVLLAEAAKLSAVLLVLNLWDARRRALVGHLRDRGVALRVLLLSPKPEEAGLQPGELLELP
jgi:uncharacterized protein (DUF58 family)